MKTEKEIREDYEEILESYRNNVASGFCRHGATGEVTGICAHQRGNLEAMEWILEITEGAEVYDHKRRMEYDEKQRANNRTTS